MKKQETSIAWQTAEVNESALLIDGENYFRALYEALTRAEQSIFIVGWQLDPQVELLRGDTALRAERPVRLWDLLNALCLERPLLRVFVLAWDYSLVYAFERDWMRMTRARLAAHKRIQFRWRAHPDPLGSHHQKFVVVDQTLAFIGGLDLGTARWDTRSHLPDDKRRADELSSRQKPFHDVQAAISGPAVELVASAFRDAWSGATGSA